MEEAIAQDYGLIDEARVIEKNMTLHEPPLFPTPPTPTPDEVAAADAKNDILRPLDRYTIPMQRKLILRTSIYSEPDNAEEKALLQLEQAKEVSDVGLQRTLLQKAAVLLEASGKAGGGSPPSSPSAAEPAASGAFTLSQITDPAEAIAVGDGEPMSAPSPSVKRRTSLWSEIIDLAWTLRDTDLVKRAVVPVLSSVWSCENNREFVVMQVKCQLTLAEG